MKQITTLSLAPCHEDWNKMTPTDKGRFCASCEKNLIDFTGKPKAEVIEILKNSPPGSCGRFDGSHFDTVESSHAPKPIWQRIIQRAALYVVLVLATLGLLSKKAKAQEKPVKTEDEKSGEKECLEAVKKKFRVSGVIKDAADSTVLPFANIEFFSDGVRIAAVRADSTGSFSIEMETAKMRGDNFSIRVSYVGYKSFEIQGIRKGRSNYSFILGLNPSGATYDTVEIVRYREGWFETYVGIPNIGTSFWVPTHRRSRIDINTILRSRSDIYFRE